MLNSKLILVEGLPGSGKSMMGQYVGMQIQRNNKITEWFSEGDKEHPLELEEYLINKPFDPNQYMEIHIEKWKSFVAAVKEKGTITVLESSIFQQPMNTLLFHNVDDERIVKHILTVLDEIVSTLNPILIYLNQNDINEAVLRASKCKGEDWTTWASQIISHSLFGESRSLHGLDGMIVYFRYRSRLENYIFKETAVNKLFIDVSSEKWNCYQSQIMNYLQIDNYSKRLEAGDLSPYCGTFFSREIECTFEFVIGNNSLVDARTGLAMVFKDDDVFYLPGLPTELIFQKNEAGQIDKFVIGGRENINIFREGIVFEKVVGEGK